MLAVDIVPGDTERTGTAGIERHHDHTVAHANPTGLSDLHHLAGGLVPEYFGAGTAEEALVLSAHGGGMHLDDHPVGNGAGLRHLDDPRSALIQDDCLFHDGGLDSGRWPGAERRTELVEGRPGL